jgi:hypothetical protein
VDHVGVAWTLYPELKASLASHHPPAGIGQMWHRFGAVDRHIGVPYIYQQSRPWFLGLLAKDTEKSSHGGHVGEVQHAIAATSCSLGRRAQ